MLEMAGRESRLHLTMKRLSRKKSPARTGVIKASPPELKLSSSDQWACYRKKRIQRRSIVGLRGGINRVLVCRQTTLHSIGR